MRKSIHQLNLTQNIRAIRCQYVHLEHHNLSWWLVYNLTSYTLNLVTKHNQGTTVCWMSSRRQLAVFSPKVTLLIQTNMTNSSWKSRLRTDPIFRRNAYKMFPTIGIGLDLFVRSTQNQLLEYLENHLIDLESPNITGTSTPILSTVTSDITSLSTSGRQLQWKTVENTASHSFRWHFSRMVWTRTMKFCTLIKNNRPHKPAGNDITSCFWSAAKCY